MNECNTVHVHSVIKCVCLWMSVSLVKFSSDLTELDLGENHIGEAGGKELLEALRERKAGVDFWNVKDIYCSSDGVCAYVGWGTDTKVFYCQVTKIQFLHCYHCVLDTGIDQGSIIGPLFFFLITLITFLVRACKCKSRSSYSSLYVLISFFLAVKQSCK